MHLNRLFIIAKICITQPVANMGTKSLKLVATTTAHGNKQNRYCKSRCRGQPNSTSCHSNHSYNKTRCRRQNLIPSLLSILCIRDVSHNMIRCHTFTRATQRSRVNQTEMQSVGTGKNMHLASTSINNADQQQFNHYMIGNKELDKRQKP